MKFPTNAELWAPFIPTDAREYDKRDARSLNVFGRLRDGATYTQARSEMNAIAGRLAAEYPATNKDMQKVAVETFNERFNGGPIRMIFLAMMGAVGFVLLIFDVAGVTIRRGRGFTATDGAAGSETIVINERMAAQFFTGEDPMGRRIKLTQRDPPPGTPPPAWRTIVGISPSIRHNSPQESQMNAVVYVPYRQDPPGFAALLVRSQLPPGSVMSAVRREVQALDQDQPVFTIETLDQALAQARWPFRVFGSLFAIFAFIALVLSAVGLYAVMAYSVTQRTQEIGVRMALGADARQVSWLILRRGLSQVAIGLTPGLAGAFGLSEVLRAILVQITPSDPVTFVAISVLLTAVAIAACLHPRPPRDPGGSADGAARGLSGHARKKITASAARGWTRCSR